MVRPQREAALYRQGRIDLACQDYQRGRFETPQSAAKGYGVPISTLRRRLEGVEQKLGSVAKNRLLTSTEEESLVQWILSMDRRGMPPRISTVRDMAGLLIAQRLANPPSVGKNWVLKFIKRHDELKSKYNRKYDHQRAKCEDPELIKGWFRRVQSTIVEYGICNDDIYNFDETGFQMGIISTSKVVTGTGISGRPRTVQPGNREWVTVIEAVGARGVAIPPLVILEAKWHQESWFENDLPSDWSITVSENGWTNNEIGLTWLKTVFDKHTKGRTIGKYRLLILDGHSSHATPEFDYYCQSQRIIVLCMPPHSSHMLQPLDVACFSVLKRSYGRLVERKMSSGVNYIDKNEFLPMFKQARAEALHEDNIKSGFSATGLVPYNPDRVLSLLHVQYHTVSPQRLPLPQLHATPVRTQITWTSETPYNAVQVNHQAELVQASIRRRSQTPSPTGKQALNKLVKGCELAMHNSVLLASENERLLAENKRQKKKRSQKRSYISKGGVLTVAEAKVIIQNKKNTRDEAIEDFQSNERKRAPSKCSLCSSLEHNVRRCPNRLRVT
ncbi:MAG: transposase [Ignavibacteria bacterium]|nr:transposase [Ignavibacteria bacterium]